MAEEKEKVKEQVKELAKQVVSTDHAIAYLLVVVFDMHCKVVGEGVATQVYHEIIGTYPPGHRPEEEDEE